MILSRYAIAVCLLSLSACTTFPDISQSRSPCRMEPGGWCSFVREGAVEAYPYAIASLQAYVGDSDVYTAPPLVLEPLPALAIDEGATRKGFGYVLFNQFARGTSGEEDRQLIARVFAFRGTDFDGFSDIFYGTLRNDQIEIAVETFEAEQARFDDGIPWVVTGHSLGGALATEVSVANPDVRAFMFNTSPFYGGNAMSNDVRRTVFNERGELLREFRKLKSAPAADVYTINCGPGRNSITKHRIRLLADCLTWIAAYSDEDANAFVKAQAIERPMVECKREGNGHPGVGHRETEPCVHQSRPDN